MTTARALFLLGVVELTALAVLGWLPAAHRFPLPGLAVFALAFAAYAVAAWRLREGADAGIARAATGEIDAGAAGQRMPGITGDEQGDEHLSGREDGDRSVRRTIWLLAIAMRLVLLPLAPTLSDDVYRYLWDGHVQLSGTNPYLHAPADPDVEELRTPFHDRINNPTVPTIYPPLAQIAFLLVAALGSSVLVAKLLWLTCDLATGWVLARVARATGRDEAPVLLLYLWAPLLVVEVAWSAHLEPLGLLFLALAMLWGHREAPARAGTALALSALAKLAPAAALPALLRRHGKRALVGFGAAVLLLYVPYLTAGGALFTGARTYGEHWWFMQGAFTVLEGVAGDPLRARLLAGACVVGAVAWTVHRRMELERALLWILGTGMIVTPTFHPWYVLWMLPMAALRRSVPWIALGGLAFIGYFGLTGYQETGSWAQPLWIRGLLWLPFFLLLVREARRDGNEPEGRPATG